MRIDELMPESPWVMASDKVPAQGQHCWIAFDKDGDRCHQGATYIDGSWVLDGGAFGSIIVDAIAWIPLPFNEEA